ncbi:hypothetical protein DFJ74DRAFT_772366 [Hyaloraphidium curvatum]|nr:hypothetical protein DFJ74DRAFT_772366 [Hyaloraphidium curvatum]
MSRRSHTAGAFALTALLSAAVLAACLGPSPAAAAPTTPADAGAVRVLFARSCGDCGDSSYCEFAYPGAPEGHIACVDADPDDRHVLFRRYTRSYTDCRGTILPATICCDGGNAEFPTVFNVGGCRDECDKRTGCTHFLFEPSDLFPLCVTYTSCSQGVSAEGYQLYALGGFG